MKNILDFLKTLTFREVVGTTEEGVLSIDYLGNGKYVGVITDFMLDTDFVVTKEGKLNKVRTDLLLIPYNSKNQELSEYRFRRMKERIPPLYKLQYRLTIHDNRYPVLRYDPKKFLEETPSSYTGAKSFYVNKLINIPFINKSIWRVAYVEYNDEAFRDMTKMFCDIEKIVSLDGTEKYIAKSKDGRYIGSVDFAMKLYKNGIWPFASVGRDSTRLDIGRRPHNGKYCGWISEKHIKCFDTEAAAAQYVVNRTLKEMVE